MLREALDLLFNKAKEQAATQQARHFTIDDFPNRVYIEHAGTLKAEEVDLPPREHTVYSVFDFVGSVKKFSEPPLVPAIWITVHGLTAILDDAKYRRETIGLTFHMTELFQLINRLGSGNGVIDQKTLSAYLRREFRNAPGSAQMLNAIKSVKFTSKEDTTQDLGRGNDTLGINIEKQVTGVGDIPEQLAVPVKLYDNLHEEFTFTFTLTLDIDTENKKFILRPLPGQITEAQNLAMIDVRERIENEFSDKEASIFFGSP